MRDSNFAASTSILSSEEHRHSMYKMDETDHVLSKLCAPYVEAYLERYTTTTSTTRPMRLQTRDLYSSNVIANGKFRPSAAAAEPGPSLEVPRALVLEYARHYEKAAICSGSSHETPLQRPKTTVELVAENGYLRALLRALDYYHHQQQRQGNPPSGDGPVEIAPHQLSSHSQQSARSPDADAQRAQLPDSQRSPSAAPPDTLGGGPSDSGLQMEAHESSVAPAFVTPLQAYNLQEQINHLREAVQELSERTSSARNPSVSPLPADATVHPFPLRTLSPSPRCATPTCTSDVPTLQNIILHQQQIIKTLQLEMEELLTAKMKVEQAVSQLGDAKATKVTHEDGEADEDEEVAEFDTTLHWRSTCHTDDHTLEGATPPDTTLGVNGLPATATASSTATAAAAERTAADAMREMDVAEALDTATARRRAATFGGMRRQLSFETSQIVSHPLLEMGGLPGAMDDDDPSSGMRTPLPRRTVVLHQRVSTAAGDTPSFCGGRVSDESPLTGPSQASRGTGSNRRTSARISFAPFKDRQE